MAKLDARQENTPEPDDKKNYHWWIWIVLAIFAILILWLVLDEEDSVPSTTESAVLLDEAKPDLIKILGLDIDRSRFV